MSGAQPGLVKDPLGRAIDQGQKWLRHNLAVKPEMHSRDRRNTQPAQIAEGWFAFDQRRRQQIKQRIVRQRRDIPVCRLLARTGARNAPSPPRLSTAARHPPYSVPRGTVGIPIKYPARLERNAFQKTSRAYRASVRARFSSRALTSTPLQKPSMASSVGACSRSQSSMLAPSASPPELPPPRRAMASM